MQVWEQQMANDIKSLAARIVEMEKISADQVSKLDEMARRAPSAPRDGTSAKADPQQALRRLLDEEDKNEDEGDSAASSGPNGSALGITPKTRPKPGVRTKGAAAGASPGAKKPKKSAQERLEAIRAAKEREAASEGGPPGSFRAVIPGVGGLGFKLLILGKRAVLCSCSEALANGGVAVGHSLVQIGDVPLAAVLGKDAEGKELEVIKALIDAERAESKGEH